MDELDETVLNIQQRQKRAQIIRRYKAKIERSRELAKKRMAPEQNIKRRAYAQARMMVRRRVAGKRGAEYEKLGPSEKMMIDRAVEGKQKLIKKIALRLLPKVKQAEQQRLHTFMKGQAIQSHGKPEGNHKEPAASPGSAVSESLNYLFSEQFPPQAERSVRESPKSNTAPGDIKPKGDEVKGNPSIVQFNKFGNEKLNDSSAYKAIKKKAEKSSIKEEVLGEVYDRGLDAWSEDTGVTQQQYAFARVNSYINQGKSYFNEDADLHELSKNTLKSYKDDATWDRDYERGAEDEKTRQKRDKGIQLAKKKLEEGRDPGKAYVKRVSEGGRDILVSSTKWGKKKYWRDSVGGLAKAKEHAGVDKITEARLQKPEVGSHHKVDEDGAIGHHVVTGVHDNVVYTQNIKTKEKFDTPLRHWHSSSSPIKEDTEMSLYDKIQAKRAEMRKNPEPEKEPPYKRKPALTAHDRDRRRLDREDDEAQTIIRKRLRKEEVQQTNENFMDGKGPGKPGDSARHGLKGKSASELKKIRSSETASPRKKQLAHWLLNMHHNESVEEGLKDPKDNPCWKDYKPVGTKKIRGKTVPNCVPVTEGMDSLFFTEESWKTTDDAVKAAKKFIDDGKSKAVEIWTHNGKFYLNDVDYSKDSKALKDFGAKLIKVVKEEVRPDPKAKVVGTNCRNCVYWRKDLEKPVTKEELNPNGGLKAPNKEYIAMSKRIDLGTLPGKDNNVKIKGFCDHDMIKDWVTERMCCSQWDSDGMIRDYKGQSPVMEADGESILPQTTSKGTKIRKKIEVVDRKPPHTEFTRQAEIKTKIIDEAGNSQNDPKKRLQGTDSLTKAYKKDTPGQCNESLNESFNIAFAAGVGVTLTSADLGMRTQGGFALHPSVIAEMEARKQAEVEEVEENVVTADKAPVVIPAHKDANGNTIPAKTVMRKKDKKIINSGNVHNGETG